MTLNGDTNSNRLPLTQQAFEKIELERDRLAIERAAHTERLRTAHEFGDPSGNDELMAVREDEAIIAARLARVEDILARAVIVDGLGGDKLVAIGSVVTLLDQDSGRSESYLIDGAHGSLDSNVISALAPMGTALLGRERGDVVRVDLPRGRVRTFTILDVARPVAA